MTFCGVPATGVVRLSPSSLSCVTPALGAGFCDVTVTNPDMQSDTAPGAFEFQ